MIRTATLLATAAALSIAAVFVGAAPKRATSKATWPKTTKVMPPSVSVPAPPPLHKPIADTPPGTDIFSHKPKPVHEKPAPRPHIDMVFALDTTGSMGGLLQGAKEKIWHIVSAVAQGHPTPVIRVGLVAYRDKGDIYVTKVTPLSHDIDHVYGHLMALSAGGGGDTPEDVDQGLYDAVHKIQWSGPQSRTLRVLFLVGDAPPHTNYQDVPSYQHTIREAARRGIVVNTIRCGNDGQTAAVWGQIAMLGHGRFLSIEENGGVVATRTPYDGKLAALSGDLDGTYVPTGDRTRRLEAFKSLHVAGARASMAGGLGSAADRAVFRAHAADAAPAPAARADIVTAYAKDKGAAEKTLKKTDLLPAKMRAMTVAQRQAYVKAQAKRRAEVRKKIDRLSRKRSAWLAHHTPKSAHGFDDEVVKVVRMQAETHAGVKY